jgi:hypothetical protein
MAVSGHPLGAIWAAQLFALNKEPSDAQKCALWDGGVGQRRSLAPLVPLPKQAFFNLREKLVEPLFCTIHFRFVKLNFSL